MNSAKLSGADWKRFYADESVWGKDAYYDDSVIHVNGKHTDDIDGTNVDDTDVVEVSNGYIVGGIKGVPEDLVECIDWWLQRQTHSSFMLTVPKDKTEAVAAALAALGVEMKGL